MEPIAIKLAKYIVLKNPKSKEKYDIYKYGLQVFLETGVSFLFSFFEASCIVVANSGLKM